MKQSLPENILIVRLSAIGDVIHTLPCLRALRAAFPQARIGWIVEELSAPLLEGHPELDDLFVIPKKRWRRHPLQTLLSGEKRRFFQKIRESNWDVAIDFQGLFKSGLAARRSGAPLRIGFGGPEARELNELFTNRRVRPPADARHVVQRNLALLRPLGIRVEDADIAWRFPDFNAEERDLQDFFEILSPSSPPNPTPPPDPQGTIPLSPHGANPLSPHGANPLSPHGAIPLSPHGANPLSPEGSVPLSPRERGRGEGRKFIALCPGAGWSTKRWPPQNFAQLARALHDRPATAPLPLVLIWGPGEEALCRSILETAALPPEALRLAPPTNLRQLAALLGRAAVVIGGDTGPVHLAAALGTPVVGIYGGSDPARNGPWGRENIALQSDRPACVPCWRTTCNHTPPLECFDWVKPGSVVEGVERILGRARAR